MKQQPCTVNPKHIWQWKRDVTLTTSPRPGVRTLSRRGVYHCGCGATKYGASRSGL